MLAEAAHSLLDVLASGFADTGIEAQIGHSMKNIPTGHEKFENFSSLVQTALLGVTSIWIFYEAGLRLLTGSAIQIDSTLYYAIAIMVFAIIADFGVSRYLFQNARKYGSSALEADAYHFSTDIYSSAAVLLGLVAAKFGYAVGRPVGRDIRRDHNAHDFDPARAKDDAGPRRRCPTKGNNVKNQRRYNGKPRHNCLP